MNPVLLVSGDFVKTGGMDMPNFAVAQHLADRGVIVHIVAHRIAEELSSHPNVRWHRVGKPLNSYFLGAPLLDRIGRRVARQGLQRGLRVLVNGGNCQVPDVNWVHYVHAAYVPSRSLSVAGRVKARIERRLGLAQERAAVGMSRIVLVNSERTRRDLVEHVGIDNSKIRTVYYGIDANRFLPVSDERRRELRAQLGWPDRPQVAFVGALGDRRKGFDTVFGAWSTLCKSPSWDCDLVVVGHGAELPKWQERAMDGGLGERIRFLGFRRDVPDLLAACDALVAPARYEAYGLGVQEALCTGLPSLVSADAGVAERYPADLSGLLLPEPESEVELVVRLQSWRERADDLRERTLEFSATLRKRTWETMASEVGDLLQSS